MDCTNAHDAAGIFEVVMLSVALAACAAVAGAGLAGLFPGAGAFAGMQFSGAKIFIDGPYVYFNGEMIGTTTSMAHYAGWTFEGEFRAQKDVCRTGQWLIIGFSRDRSVASMG